MDTPKYWTGRPEEDCQLCGSDFGKSMHDVAVQGHWGNICDACFVDNNCSVGQGRGQSYRKQDNGRWMKVAG